MKLFAKNLFCFFIALFAFYFILWIQYAWRMSDYSFVLPKIKTVLVVGDSQTQADINDSICNNVQNISLAHDGYFSMYKRIQLYIDANPQINTVVLAMTPHTMSPVKDEFYYNFGYVEETTKHYLPYFNVKDWWLLLSCDPVDVLSALVTPLRFYFTPSHERIKEMGFFEAADYSHLKEDVKSGALRLIPDTTEFKYGNEITLKYLHEIVSYCKEKNLRLIGINTPVFHGEKYFDMKNYRKLMSADFKGIEVWDDMDMEFPDSCRRDVNHLNKWGAMSYSVLLRNRLK